MVDRKCRKCENSIPYKKEINGKIRNLQGRKFCLECSPFGNHNTKSDIDKETVRGNKPFSEWDEDYKKSFKQKMYNRRFDRKQKLVDLAGGKCSICSYDKCMKALSFHHVNPKTKSFGLSSENLHNRSWDVILEEFKKCILVCMNCHAEIHS